MKLVWDRGEAPGWASEGLRSVGPREGTVSSEPLCLVCKMKLRKEKWSQLLSCVQRWPECNWRQSSLRAFTSPIPHPWQGPGYALLGTEERWTLFIQKTLANWQ